MTPFAVSDRPDLWRPSSVEAGTARIALGDGPSVYGSAWTFWTSWPFWTFYGSHQTKQR
jgi:hypothetical protein